MTTFWAAVPEAAIYEARSGGGKRRSQDDLEDQDVNANLRTLPLQIRGAASRISVVRFPLPRTLLIAADRNGGTLSQRPPFSFFRSSISIKCFSPMLALLTLRIATLFANEFTAI